MQKIRWFAVKTLYRTRVVGRPARRDAAYDGDANVVEERVVLFRARSFDDAIRKAEREARAYARALTATRTDSVSSRELWKIATRSSSLRLQLMAATCTRAWSS